MTSGLLDIHTHNLPQQQDTALWSCCMKDWNKPEFAHAAWISVGIHPRYLTADDLPQQLAWAEHVIATDRRVIAVGESGIDKLCETPLDIQMQAFEYSAALAEKYHLPLIIHAVRSHNELIAIKKKLRSSSPWIIHGFRGKKELAESLLRQGFYLSIGEKFNPETAGFIPDGQLLTETDESHSDILSIQNTLANLRGKNPEEFRRQLCLNTGRLFFGH